MADRTFRVKYEGRQRPLEKVFHLIAEVKKALPSKLGDIDIDELTLHYEEDGAALGIGLALRDLTSGQDYLVPLIIKSRDQTVYDLKVNYSGYNGISLQNNQFIERTELIEHIVERASETLCTVIAAPRATGKTSVLQLLGRTLKSKEFSVLYQSCTNSKQAIFDYLKAKGVSVIDHTSTINNRCYVFLDDAQEKSEDGTFWGALLKFPWQRNIHFIVSTRFLFNTASVCLAVYPRIVESAFILSEAESYAVLNLDFIGLPSTMRNFTILKKGIVKACNGLIGSIAMVCQHLGATVHGRNPTETDCLRKLLAANFVVKFEKSFINELTSLDDESILGEAHQSEVIELSN